MSLDRHAARLATVFGVVLAMWGGASPVVGQDDDPAPLPSIAVPTPIPSATPSPCDPPGAPDQDPDEVDGTVIPCVSWASSA